MPTGNRQRGYALMAALIALMVLSLLLQSRVVEQKQVIRRQHEQDLLVVGDEMARALQSYRDAHGGQYPQSLSDLLDDTDGPVVRHHLRRLYRDPVSNTADWGLERGPGGGIVAVYSPSALKPFKQDGFDADHSSFKERDHYSDWKFAPPQQNGGSAPN